MNKAINAKRQAGFSEAVKLAIEKGGYQEPVELRYSPNDVGIRLLATIDPAFWQALGKALGWTSVYHYCEQDNGCCATCVKEGKACHRRGFPRDGFYGNTYGNGEEWLYHWHRFIDHIADGKDIDSFFKELIK